MDSRLKLARVLVGGALVLLTATVGFTAATGGTAGATRLKKPGPPTALSLATVGYEVSASWSPPISDGGTPITGYVVSVTVHSSIGSNDCVYMTTPTSCILGVTSTPRVYRVKVHARAINSVGQGKAADGTVLTSATPDCTYTGPWADVANCDLVGADLAGLNLEKIWMPGADLAGADLAGDNLNGVEANPATFTDANLMNADILGNLAGSDLAGADLAGATVDAVLDGADLTNANFTNADLTGVESGGIIGTPSALPSSFVLDDGYLIGPGAYLEHADFSGVNLTGVNLTNANLEYATTNSQTNFSDVMWSNTTCPDGTNSNNDGDTCVNNLG